MDQPTATILSGGAVAIVTIVGWLAVHYLTRSREIESRSASASAADRTKRLEILLKQHERQIEELYGPIYTLLQFIYNVWQIRKAMVKDLAGMEPPEKALIEQVDWFVGENYFHPTHDEIRTILKSRLFLIEGAEMPKSFAAYLEHSMMENIKIRLRKDAKIDVPWSSVVRFPTQFDTDIKAGLSAALMARQKILDNLNSRAFSEQRDTP